jgi:outer membrane protein
VARDLRRMRLKIVRVPFPAYSLRSSAFGTAYSAYFRLFLAVNLSLVLLVFLPLWSYAQQSEEAVEDMFRGFSDGETLEIGVEDAILNALENNPTLAIQRLEPPKAMASVESARSDFDPEVNVSINRSETKSERHLGTQPEPIDLTTERTEESIEISKTFSTGTTLSAGATVNGTISSLYTDQYVGNVSLALTQSLLRGFGRGANLASLRKAKIDVEISREELRAVAENLVAQVEKAYWDLYLAKEEISIQQESLELALRQLNESNERVAVGKLAEIELAAVHAAVASRREALIDAQSRYEKARLQFLYLLNPQGQDMWSMKPVTTDSPFIPEDTMDSLDVHEQLGLKYRSDLQQARLSLEKGKLDVQQTKNGLLPRLDFFISYGRSTYAESFSDAMPDLQSPFDDLSTGLNFNMPISNRSAKANYRKSLHTREQMELSVKNMEKLVALDVRSAYVEALRSRQLIEATRVTRELQQMNMDAELEKFRVGKSTNFLVLTAQSIFTAGKLDEARAMVDYLNALIDLYHLQGTLLERRGIESPAEVF